MHNATGESRTTNLSISSLNILPLALYNLCMTSNADDVDMLKKLSYTDVEFDSHIKKGHF